MVKNQLTAAIFNSSRERQTTGFAYFYFDHRKKIGRILELS